MLAGERRKCGQGILSFAKSLSPAQTTTTAHHDKRPPLLPTKETVIPCQMHNRCLGAAGWLKLHPLLAPSSSPKCKYCDMAWFFPTKTGCSDIHQEPVYGLYYPLNTLTWTERGLIGKKPPQSKFAVKPVNEHMPKSVP